MSYIHKLFALYKIFYDKGYHLMYSDNKEVIRYEKDDIPLYNKFYNLVNNPCHIIDNLYIGSAYNAADYYMLKELNIGLIINVTSEISNYYPDYFRYHKIEIEDINEHSLIDSFEETFNIINDYKCSRNESTDNKNIMVHCYMGASRSASIIVVYLIKKYKMNLDEAIQYMKSKRPETNINITFIDEIKKYLAVKNI